MWVSLVRLGGRLIMVSHGLPGGLQGSCVLLYRFALRVLWFPRVAGWPLRASQSVPDSFLSSVFWFCEADVVPCFSGSIPVVFSGSIPVVFSGSIPVVFSGSIPVVFFRLETCGYSG